MEDADWYLHYGLDRDPFAEGGVQGLFYPGGGRQEIVEQLQHLARFGDSVLLVAGAAGAGKSATLAHFVAQCGADTRCAVVETALLDGPEQLLRRVLAGFGLPMVADPDLAHGLQRLASFCEQCRGEGVLCWLVFDDAQHLHADALALLAPLLAQTSGRLRLILFAEESWSTTLRAALPATVMVHLIELAPLERDESHAYLHYRLKTAGLESEPPFNAAELEDIHRLSGGMPGRIDALARQLLIDELEVEQRPLASLPLWHLGVVVVTLLLLGGLYVWNLFGKDDAMAEQSRSGGVREITTDAAATVRGDAPPIADVGVKQEAAAQVAAPQPAEPAGADVAASRTSAPAPVPAPEPEPEPGPEPESAPTAPVGVPPQAGAGAPRTAVAPAVVAAPPAAASADTDEEYLLSLDGSHYLLQLMAADDLQKLQRFAARQSLPLRRYSKLSQGRRWYALVHGDYPDQVSAQRAAREITAELGGQAPWVRRVDAVQREIRAGRSR